VSSKVILHLLYQRVRWNQRWLHILQKLTERFAVRGKFGTHSTMKFKIQDAIFFVHTHHAHVNFYLLKRTNTYWIISQSEHPFGNSNNAGKLSAKKEFNLRNSNQDHLSRSVKIKILRILIGNLTILITRL